jgi:hypothetical protein
MKAIVKRPVPGGNYEVGKEYDFDGGGLQWLVKGRYIEPIIETKEKAVVTPSEKR